jgi:hypothetical protein
MRLITAFAIVVTTCVAGPRVNGEWAMGDGQRAMGNGPSATAKGHASLPFAHCPSPMAAAQTPAALSAPDVKEISGRWIGTVNADIGTMPIALDLKAKDDKVSGALETGHGNWEVREVKKQEGVWVISIKAPDGLEGTMTGRVKDGKLTGDWNFKPRAVGTFALARPANSGK